MVMFNAGNTNPQQLINQVAQTLAQVRAAMDAARDLHAWSSGIADTDLTAIGMELADADALLSACADAFGMTELYDKGTTTASFPAGYVFGASQRRVIGARPS